MGVLLRMRGRRTRSGRLAAAGAAVLCAVGSANASVTVYAGDFGGWQQAVSGSFQTCDFLGFPLNTFITDQYAPLGVYFTNPGPNVVLGPSTSLFPQDLWGLGPVGTLELTFLDPQHAVGAHSPASWWKMRLYLGDTLVGQSYSQTGGASKFVGLTSDIAFDRVQFEATGGGPVATDNIYFSTVPGPGAVGLLELALLTRSRRR